MNAKSNATTVFPGDPAAPRPAFLASECSSWVTRMMLCGGRTFADVAEFSRDILGYRRLPQSTDRAEATLRFYEFTFAENWVVISPDQLRWAEHRTKPWWGIIVNSPEDGCKMIRAAEISPVRKSIAIAELLWAAEIKVLLESCCDVKPMAGRRRMREQIAEALPPDQLGPLASITVKSRPRWRAKAA